MWCFGCCWALMLVLVLAGMMGLVWVAGLGAIVAIEKLSSRGMLVSGLTGVVFLIAAINPGGFMSSWQLNGNIIIACNCDFDCPCNFNAPPSHGKCEGGWVWAITDGLVRDVRVDGLVVALYAAWPGAIHEGAGRAVAYMEIPPMTSRGKRSRDSSAANSAGRGASSSTPTN